MSPVSVKCSLHSWFNEILISILLMALCCFMYQLLQIAWVFIRRNAEWKPLQFLAFIFVYRMFEKLKAFEPPTPTFSVSMHKIALLSFALPLLLNAIVSLEHVHHWCEVYMKINISFSYAIYYGDICGFYGNVHIAFQVHSSFICVSSGGRRRWRTDDEDGKKAASFSCIGLWLYSYCILGMFSVRLI